MQIVEKKFLVPFWKVLAKKLHFWWILKVNIYRRQRPLQKKLLGFGRSEMDVIEKYLKRDILGGEDVKSPLFPSWCYTLLENPSCKTSHLKAFAVD